ncbi:hypothetical protein [Chitinophaga defluvii]|uniref:Uncharacterized protein n=1 Tax=Chitinophaga defluvii TaxID=3163343 RepID=A0ABV2T361_9BACT
MGVAEINLIGAVAKGNLYLKESNCLIPLWVELEGKPIAIK